MFLVPFFEAIIYDPCSAQPSVSVNAPCTYVYIAVHTMFKDEEFSFTFIVHVLAFSSVR